MSSQLLKIKMSNLIKLGYKNPEIQWFNNASNLLKNNKYSKDTIYHNHFPDLSYDIKYYVIANKLKKSGFPMLLNDIYTATLMTCILHYGFDSWANNNVHLDYHTVLHNFYSQKTCLWSAYSNLDTVTFGNKLLSHQFVKPVEYAQLQHFRSIQRESKICPTDLHQLMMSVEMKM